MCRLYGFRSNEQTKVECSLVYAQNAMLNQSVRDTRGEQNADGWGIGYYEDGVAKIERRDTAAHSDDHFSLTAERVFAHTVVAHVRGATVGALGLENTHPFNYGRWVFAHNGTVQGFEEIRAQLDEDMDQDLLDLRRGTTDSETAFLWVLTRMRRAGMDLQRPAQRLADLVDVLRHAVLDLDALCATQPRGSTSKLNFLLTDGRSLAASCCRRDLSYVKRSGIHDCEICGIPHIQHDERARYRAVVVASEPITHECWQPVPDGTIISVSENVATTLHSI